MKYTYCSQLPINPPITLPNKCEVWGESLLTDPNPQSCSDWWTSPPLSLERHIGIRRQEVLYSIIERSNLVWDWRAVGEVVSSRAVCVSRDGVNTGSVNMTNESVLIVLTTDWELPHDQNTEILRSSVKSTATIHHTHSPLQIVLFIFSLKLSLSIVEWWVPHCSDRLAPGVLRSR